LVQKVMAIVKQSNVEESLATTLPPCLAKRERGTFDQVVIGQAEEALRGKAATLGEAIARSEEQLVARKSTAQAACAELDAAKLTHGLAIHEFRTAQETSQGVLENSVQAKSVFKQFEANLAELESKLDAMRNELETFCTYHIVMFNLLRDQTAEKANVEAAVEPPIAQPMEPVAERVEDAHDSVVRELTKEPVAKVQEQLSADMVASLAGVAGA